MNSKKLKKKKLTPPSLASPELPITSSIPSNASTTATSRVPPPKSTTSTVSSSKGAGGSLLASSVLLAGTKGLEEGVVAFAPSALARGEPRP